MIETVCVDDFSMYELVQRCKAISAERGQPINTLAYFQHGEVGHLNVGMDVVHSLSFYEYGGYYAIRFEQPGEIMSTQWYERLGIPSPVYEQRAQIQFYCCKVAGYNTFAEETDTFYEIDAEGEIVTTAAFESFGARSMLTTIADLTGALVFANSDSTRIDYDEHNGKVRGMIDACLEFGVGPGGFRVSYDFMDCKFSEISTGKSWQEIDVSTPYTTKNGGVSTCGETGGPPWMSLSEFYYQFGKKQKNVNRKLAHYWDLYVDFERKRGNRP